jgi:anaerobic magnesium-protoporphyrin IX monomethyl ester cyclase
LLRGETIDALRRAGCHTVWIGAESGSQKILDAMEKGIWVEQIYEACRRLHNAGIQVGLFLQFGYPGEDRYDIERTLQMVRDCRPDDIGMSVSYPLPGTTFFEQVKSQLGIQHNWHDSNDLAMLYTGPYTTEFYRQLHKVVHKEFRARRTWHKLVDLMSHPTRLTRHDLRQAVAMVYHFATLPMARRKLGTLAKSPHTHSFALPTVLNLNAAAKPKPQHE